MTKEGESMKVEERLDAHEKRFNQHGDRLLQLEKRDEEKHKRLKDVELNYAKLENTILTENKEMRNFFQSNMDKLWDLTKSRDEQSHETRRMRHEISKTKIDRWSDIIFKVVGSGGILYLIAQALIK